MAVVLHYDEFTDLLFCIVPETSEAPKKAKPRRAPIKKTNSK